MLVTSDDIVAETKNDNGMSNIESTSRRSGGGEGSPKNWQYFETNGFCNLKKVEMEQEEILNKQIKVKLSHLKTVILLDKGSTLKAQI